MNVELLRAQLMIDEGLELFPYKDTVNLTTVGYGRNLEGKGLSKQELSSLGLDPSLTKKQVIDVLTKTGITKQQALFLLDNDIREVYGQLKKALPWFESKPDVVQRVMCNICYNIGQAGLFKFKKTLELIRLDKYEDAAKEMMNSLWATQVKGRAVRLSNLLKAQANTGK